MEILIVTIGVLTLLLAGVLAVTRGHPLRIFPAAGRTARLLGLEETGYRVVFNTGRDALQTVPYLHGHILAGRTLGWPPG